MNHEDARAALGGARGMAVIAGILGVFFLAIAVDLWRMTPPSAELGEPANEVTGDGQSDG
jgi:hypothetical protein